MIETIISRVKEEIAIDGTLGSNMDKVWQYVETITKEIATKSGHMIEPIIDEKYKSFLWNYLKLEQDLEFYYADIPVQTTASPLETPKSKPKSKKKKAKKVDDQDNYIESESDESEDEFSDSGLVISDESLVRKSNPKSIKSNLENEPPLKLMPIQNAADLLFEDVKKLYGDRLHILASAQLQEEQLYVGITHGQKLSNNLVIILKEIIKTRSVGLYQASITKLLDIDSRSTGHYVKSLEEKGAIVRKGVAINGMFTNICVHNRFSIEKEKIDMNTVGEDDDLNEVPYNVNSEGKTFSQHDMLLAMVEITKDAPNNAALARDVLHSLGFNTEKKTTRKWFNRTLDILCLKGYFKKTNVKVNNSGKPLRGIHLLKLPEERPNGVQTITDNDIQFPIKITSTKVDVSPMHLLVDSPVESQCSEVLRVAGTNGATQRDLAFALNINEHRLLAKVLEKICEQKNENHERYGAVRFLEFEGRLRRYRYYTHAAYKLKTENIEITFPPCTDTEFDESKFFERNLYFDIPHESRAFNKYILESKRGSNESELLSVSALARSPAKKLGRPRKQPAPEGEPTDTTPRKRGRKPKNATVEASRKKTKSTETDTNQTEDIPMTDNVTNTPIELSPTPVDNTESSIVDNSVTVENQETPVTSTVENTSEPTETPIDVEMSTEDVVENNNTPTVNETPSVNTETESVEPIETNNPSTSNVETPIENNSVPSQNGEIIKNRITQFHKLNTEKQKNSYLESRVFVLQKVLEETPIIEMGKDLATIFSTKSAQLNFPLKTTIDGKTLLRTACELEKRNMANIDIVECPLLNGKTLTRKLLIRKDIDMKGHQYRNYVRYLKERKAMQVVSYGIKQLEVVDLNTIETLDQRIQRMRNELKTLQEQGEIKKAHELEIRIDALSKNHNTFSQPVKTSGTNYWAIKAIQSGWVNARMIRCKLLHAYLLGLLDQDLVGVKKQERTITINTIVGNMSLYLYCQVIGLFNYSGEISTYVQDHENSGKLVQELPVIVKKHIFGEQNKFRRRLYSLLSMLDFIGLVSPINSEVYEVYRANNNNVVSFIAPEYRLNTNVEIKDYIRMGHPVLRQHVVENKSDAMLFWSELEYACKTSDTENIPEGESAMENMDSQQKELVTTLYSLKNWSIKSVFTRAQKKMLNSYVDRINHTTPIDNITILRSIADSLQLSVPDIKSYYQKVQAALERKLEHSEMKRVERILIPRRKKGKRRLEEYEGRIISLSSTRAFKRIKKADFYIKEIKVRPEVAMLAEKEKERIIEQRANGEMLYMDDLGDLPVIEKSSDANLQRERFKRAVWNSQEDELLLYATIILRQRSGNNKVFWAPMRQIFPDRSPNTCRHRYSKMMQNPVYVEQLETNARLWLQIYEEGVRSGELEDLDPLENINFDLLGFVTFFIRRLTKSNLNLAGYFILPKTVETLHNQYEVTLSTKSNIYYEDKYHEKSTLIAKQQVLYAQSITLRKYDDIRYDQSTSLIEKENDKTYRLKCLFRLFSLMTLMTPAELYDQFYCYTMLQKFPQNVYEETLSKMQEEGTLIKKPGARPIPGTRQGLSAKFINTMVGELPSEMIKQATEYEKFLSTQDSKIRYSPTFISSGMMACLLNLLSSNRLSITFSNMEHHLKKMQSTVLVARNIDKSLIEFDLDILKTDNADQFMTYVPQPSVANLIKLSKEEYETALSNLVKSENNFFEKRGLIKQTAELLYNQAELGCTLYELKSKLTKYTDEDIMRSLHKLCSNSPPLVCRVGFEAVRYVHIAFIHEWTITSEGCSYNKYSHEIKEKLAESSGGLDIPDKKPIIVPNLWTDTNGNITDLVLKECKEGIIDLVIRRPGITEADIHRRFKTALTRREIRDLLNILVEQQALKQVRTHVVAEPKKKKSIFAKPGSAKCMNSNTIEKLSQSCFWVTPYTYASLS